MESGEKGEERAEGRPRAGDPVAGLRGTLQLVGLAREREQWPESGKGLQGKEEQEGGSPGWGAAASWKQLCLSEQDVLRNGGGGVIKSFLVPLCIG